MEYVIVEFAEDRGVLIDGGENGRTNQTLMVQEGTHEFTLSGAADFTPATTEILVQYTASDDPMKITFEKRV
ncbi:MAG: PEGA domain-containing protein [Alphaproteobacteria bacterium]|jgi:hypothetical protein|nr:PEGA domain-containing protein [Alphaproteobacteria bacterium]